LDGGSLVVTETMQEVVADMDALIRERLAEDEQRPFPYATTRCAERCPSVHDPPHASKVIRSLVRIGVVEHVGNMPRRNGMRDGTKIYSPTYLPATQEGNT
jgi:hypothetical protein